MRSGISRAHSHWLAERIAQCTWSGQCNTDWYGLVRTGTDMAQNVCVPCAFEFPERMARTTPCAPRSVLFRTHPYLSVRHCPQYRLCAMRSASQQPPALFPQCGIFGNYLRIKNEDRETCPHFLECQRTPKPSKSNQS